MVFKCNTDREDIMSDVNNDSDVSDVARTVSSYLPDFDVILFTGDIINGVFVNLQEVLRKRESGNKKKVYFFIGTSGGSPHEAFRMMRLLRMKYDYIGVVLFGECYSAGTLFALGANEILMSPGSNLGPLDVQMRREDDLSRMSGECYRQALSDISSVAQSVFFDLFGRLKSRQDILISTQTASHAACEIVKGLLSPITQQIEPTRLGEMMRSQGIGISYCVRLMRHIYGDDKAYRIANHLARNYPSHNTIIDFEEAKELGVNVTLINPEVWASGIFLPLEKKLLTREYLTEPVICELNSMEVM